MIFWSIKCKVGQSGKSYSIVSSFQVLGYEDNNKRKLETDVMFRTNREKAREEKTADVTQRHSVIFFKKEL